MKGGASEYGVLSVTATTTAGMTPQPGLEMLNPLEGNPTGVVVTRSFRQHSVDLCRIPAVSC